MIIVWTLPSHLLSPALLLLSSNASDPLLKFHHVYGTIYVRCTIIILDYTYMFYVQMLIQRNTVKFHFKNCIAQKAEIGQVVIIVGVDKGIDILFVHIRHHLYCVQLLLLYCSLFVNCIFKMSITSALAEINASTDHKTKTEKYKALLTELVKGKNVANLRLFIDHSIIFICIIEPL